MRPRWASLPAAANPISAFLLLSYVGLCHCPVHPRTRQKMEKFGLLGELSRAPIHLLPPLSYQEFLRTWKDASLVMTDSGGLQEETTALGVPCFAIRDNTERPITLEEGTNTLVGTKMDGILAAYEVFRNGGSKACRIPDYWDGKASQRIVPILANIQNCNEMGY
ncbi:MAG: UDP-N-acetylglucosamine 2-epimerase [Syntrophobacteraceae bacterium]